MALIAGLFRWHEEAMSYLGAPNRGNDPLNVWLMALALVGAAMVGAGIGFLIDLVSGDEEEVVGTTAEP